MPIKKITDNDRLWPDAKFHCAGLYEFKLALKKISFQNSLYGVRDGRSVPVLFFKQDNAIGQTSSGEIYMAK